MLLRLANMKLRAANIILSGQTLLETTLSLTTKIGTKLCCVTRKRIHHYDYLPHSCIMYVCSIPNKKGKVCFYFGKRIPLNIPQSHTKWKMNVMRRSNLTKVKMSEGMIYSWGWDEMLSHVFSFFCTLFCDHGFIERTV